MRGDITLKHSQATPRARWTVSLLAVGLALAVFHPARADDLKDGRAALQAGRYDEALQLFEKAASQGLAAGRAGVG